MQSVVKFYDIDILILEHLVVQEGLPHFASALAMVYTNKAVAVGEFGDLQAAAVICDKAIMLFEQLMYQECYRDLVGDWARVRSMRAIILIQLGVQAQGIFELHQAVQTLQAEVARTGRADLQGVLNAFVQVLRQVT